MSNTVRITSLLENTAGRQGTLGEPGLALWLETKDHCALFDTGASGAIVSNAKALGVDLSQTDAVVLSHGHYDHTGGLSRVLPLAPKAGVFCHPGAFAQKFARNKDGTSRYIGMSPQNKKSVRETAKELVHTREPTHIGHGFWVTGEIPRLEKSDDDFFLDESCAIPDPMRDDQALYFDSTHGIVVLLGCAHAGVGNTLRQISQLTNGKPIHAVLGGMHLRHSTGDEIQQTIETFRNLGLNYLAPAHCTGMPATAALWAAFPGKCHSFSVGTSVEFELYQSVSFTSSRGESV